jgi:hypothetical protein
VTLYPRITTPDFSCLGADGPNVGKPDRRIFTDVNSLETCDKQEISGDDRLIKLDLLLFGDAFYSSTNASMIDTQRC